MAKESTQPAAEPAKPQEKAIGQQFDVAEQRGAGKELARPGEVGGPDQIPNTGSDRKGLTPHEETRPAPAQSDYPRTPPPPQPGMRQTLPEGDAWDDGQPLTTEQRQSRPDPNRTVDPQQALTPESTGLPQAKLDDILRYLPAVLEIITGFKEFDGMTVGSSEDFGPVKTWLPTGGHYELTLHANRTS